LTGGEPADRFRDPIQLRYAFPGTDDRDLDIFRLLLPPALLMVISRSSVHLFNGIFRPSLPTPDPFTPP
jgi:hypothetical protein